MARASGARVATPAPPVPKSGDVASPGHAIKTSGPAARDPRFLRVVTQVQRTAVALKKHAPAARKAAEAQAAAVPPGNERSAGAKADQVDAMQDARTESPKPSSFLALLRAEIEKVMPKTLDDSQHFMEGGAKDQVKAAVGGNVQQSKDAATGPVEDAATATPDPAAIPARNPEPAPSDAPVATASIDTQGAVPPPKPAAEVSQQKYTDTADAQFKAANISDTQLQKANDPRFSATLGAKKGLQAKVAASPGQFRGAEHRIAAVGIARAAADGRGQLVGMAGQRERQAASVKSRQHLAKERDEQRRKTVTDKIEGIYQKTRVSVELGLSTLETDVMAAFDGGMNTALADLQTWTAAEIKKFKDERYDGLAGKARWIADLFRPVPPEIKQILAQGKTRFTAAMDAVAVTVAGLVDKRLATAKSEIKKGQAEIAGYVASLPADLKSVGKAAEGELQARFKELEDGIDAKKQALAASLANKYKEANEKGDAELQKVEAANAGALKGLTDQLDGVFKIISEFKDKLVGILRKGQETINLILADPIGFLGNLINAVKGGLNAFVGNLKSWLLKGLASWLFGSLAETGITMPADLSLGSIFKLVMELLGISYAKIRGKAVKLVGEPVVKTVETLAEFAKVFITGGPAALWAHIKEQLADLKSMVLDAIISWVKETIVTQAVAKIVSMCNPAGAFVQACIAIYNVVMFLVERAKQLVAFVDSIVNSVHNIATGNIGGAVSWIEQALGRAVPIVISFFARLIGLGGITAKIVSIVKKVQEKVDKALDVVLGTVIGGLKKLVAKAGAMFKGKPDSPENVAAKVEKARTELPPTIKAFLAKKPGKLKTMAQMALWRRSYGLVKLELVGEGQGTFRGTINPTIDLGNGWTFPTNELVQIVDEIAADLKREGQLELQRQNAGTSESGITSVRPVTGGEALAGLPDRGTVHIGVDNDGKPVGYRHQDSPITPAWGEIAALSGARGKMYPQFERLFAGKPIGRWLAALVQDRPLPPEATPYSDQIGELYGLLYAKEPSHGKKISHQRDLTYSLMLNQVIYSTEAQGASVMLQNHPATYVGAQAGARSMSKVAIANGKVPSEKNRKGEPSKTHAGYMKRRGREKRTVALWFAQHSEEFKTSVLENVKKDGTVNEAKPNPDIIKAFIRTKLTEFIKGAP